MIVYAESSGVLAWLLGEPTADLVRAELASAERVITSALTAVECARGLSRARRQGRIDGTAELAALRLLDVAESNWDVHRITDRVLARARARFPVEPVRTLDAIHLATAAGLLDAVGQLAMISFDERVRTNAGGLGLELIPR
ncbi:MAG: type II toxin-antitoxin system VapC family toxin [Gemmatimonadales bacterium]